MTDTSSGKQPLRFKATDQSVGLSNRWKAGIVNYDAGPPPAVDGLTVGLATMTENPPHGGEMHPDGDEVLILVSGRVDVLFEEEDFEDVQLQPGDGLVVPAGAWHRVDVLKPSQLVYLTPGPERRFRTMKTLLPSSR